MTGKGHKPWKRWRKNLARKFQIHPLEIIQWEATRRCDMCCVHCGSPKEASDLSSELTTGEVEAALRQIHDEFDLSGFKFITITGGEPFLREDLGYVLGLFQSFGWITTIQTNGNYLAHNPDAIPRFVSLGVAGIGVDLDGNEDMHDSLRGRVGHYRQTQELIRNLLGFSAVLHTTVTTVVTKETLAVLPELWETIRNLNPHRWRLLPVETIGRAGASTLGLDGADYISLLNFIAEKRLLHLGEARVQTELGCNGWLGTSIEGVVRPYIWSCIAGRTCLGIMHDGGLGACAHIDRAFLQGNVREDNILGVWKNGYGIFRNRPPQELCSGCKEKAYCALPMHKLQPNGKLRDCIFRKIQTEGR